MRYVYIGKYIGENPDAADAFPVIYPEQALCDKAHGNLFHFLNADLFPLESRLTQYAFSVSSGGAKPQLDTFYEEFGNLHPYFQNNPANVSMLLNRAFASVITGTGLDNKRLRRLMRKLYAPRGISGVCDADHWLKNAMPEDACSGRARGCLSSLIRDQSRLRRMAVFLLDNGTASISAFPPNTRLGLYGLCADMGSYWDIDGFIPVSTMKIMYGRVTGGELMDKGQYNIPDRDALDREVFALERDPSFSAPLVSKTAKMIASSPRAVMDEVLYPSSLFDLLSFEIAEMYRHSEQICREKDGTFPVEKPEDYIADLSDKSMLDKEIKDVYRKAYKTHYARIKYGTMTREQFDSWAVSAREMKDRALRREIFLSDFSKWLKP